MKSLSVCFIRFFLVVFLNRIGKEFMRGRICVYYYKWLLDDGLYRHSHIHSSLPFQPPPPPTLQLASADILTQPYSLLIFEVGGGWHPLSLVFKKFSFLTYKTFYSPQKHSSHLRAYSRSIHSSFQIYVQLLQAEMSAVPRIFVHDFTVHCTYMLKRADAWHLVPGDGGLWKDPGPVCEYFKFCWPARVPKGAN
jgi:hypothetical protein